MKTIFLILVALSFISCMDITIPDFKSDREETESGEEPTQQAPDENTEPDQSPGDSYPLLSTPQIPEDAIRQVSLFVFYGTFFNLTIDYSALIVELEDNPASFYIGYCSRVNNNQNLKVKINNDYWKQLTPSYKQQLMFHELGHCLLDRPHTGNDFYNPQSILNETLFPSTIYNDRYDYFIKELFGNLNSSYQFSYRD